VLTQLLCCLQQFQGRHGRAYLVNNVYASLPVCTAVLSRQRINTWLLLASFMFTVDVALYCSLIAQVHGCATHCRVNVTLGPKEERLLITGLHSVADIHCTSCNTVIGWKYVRLIRCQLTASSTIQCR